MLVKFTEPSTPISNRGPTKKARWLWFHRHSIKKGHHEGKVMGTASVVGCEGEREPHVCCHLSPICCTHKNLFSTLFTMFPAQFLQTWKDLQVQWFVFIKSGCMYQIWFNLQVQCKQNMTFIYEVPLNKTKCSAFLHLQKPNEEHRKRLFWWGCSNGPNSVWVAF